jgi:predicted metal-dependent HD superfamily phosphohydrolase
VPRLVPRGPDVPEALLSELRAAYATPPRGYHSWAHVEAVLAEFDALATAGAWSEGDTAFWALLFHDAVYDAREHDNEERSAALATALLPKFGIAADVPRVAELISLTARHGQLTPADVDAEAALFLDCDLAILAAPQAVFDAYDAGVAFEYAFVEPELYRAGRAAFLQRLLDKPRRFLTERFHAERDARACANLRRALASPRQRASPGVIS